MLVKLWSIWRSATILVYCFSSAGARITRDELNCFALRFIVVQAQTGRSYVLGGADRLRPPPRTVPWRMTILWSALGLGVVLLAWMAYRLSRELGRGATEKRQ